MARTQINLNRFRKIYPQLRKSPVWWTRDLSGSSEAFTIDIANGDSLTLTLSNQYNSPVAVASTDDNVNVWIHTLNYNGAEWEVTVAVSDTGFTGKIYVHILEGNP